MYHCFIEAFGLDAEPEFGPDCPSDVVYSNADITKARTMLGYAPDWSFERGIKEAIHSYKENL